MVEIGRRLTECKKLLGHGHWLPWLESEFGWTDDTAINLMNVYEMSKSQIIRDLKISATVLYLLAARSTPEPVRTKVIEQAKTGQKIKVKDVKKEIKMIKATPEIPKPIIEIPKSDYKELSPPSDCSKCPKLSEAYRKIDSLEDETEDLRTTLSDIKTYLGEDWYDLKEAIGKLKK